MATNWALGNRLKTLKGTISLSKYVADFSNSLELTDVWVGK